MLIQFRSKFDVETRRRNNDIPCVLWDKVKLAIRITRMRDPHFQHMVGFFATLKQEMGFLVKYNAMPL